MESKCATFLAHNNKPLHETSNQKKDILFDFPRVSPGDQPLTKKPEDSGFEIDILVKLCYHNFLETSQKKFSISFIK